MYHISQILSLYFTIFKRVSDTFNCHVIVWNNCYNICFSLIYLIYFHSLAVSRKKCFNKLHVYEAF